MYIPEDFVASDKTEIVAFMKQYSFATIVTVKDNFQSATHLPFVITMKDSEITLVSHFAKANSQWKEIIENQCLIIFAEPNAYISPGYYDKDLNVPTWNYISVHAYGEGRVITDTEECFKVMELMIDTYEADYKAQWKKLPMDYKQRMIKGTVPFEITVKNIQAKKKLSQDKTKKEQERIIDGLSKKGNGPESQLADFMRKNLFK